MLDDFKKNLLLDLIAAEIKNVRRGDSVYGDAADQFDAFTALNELHEELTRTGKITGEDPEEVREENLISHGAGSDDI